MRLLIKAGGAAAFPQWKQAFATHAPDLDVLNWDDPVVDPATVDFALVWTPPEGWLAGFPNLKVILSAAAGVDHILADPRLPRHIPLVRMVTDETISRMGDYVCLAALSLARDLPQILHAQQLREWRSNLTGRLVESTTVGILGLGQLGQGAAKRLNALGFKVAGWSRSPKMIPGVTAYQGPLALRAFLAKTDILVNLLPHTAETHQILNRETLSYLPAGAGLVNVGRGTHLDTDALLAALDSGAIRGAILDVFDSEPLDQQSALWRHPGVIVTPHIASTASYDARARQVSASILHYQAGSLPLPFSFDYKLGY